ncbi:MAG TPA: G8 domain-containing protein, partial [Trueperaceae bacterium]|nr:G8 domain-containing protein [Trueperaceae bacterium]
MPATGEVVEIPAGDVVLLDVDTPALGGLLIAGALVFDHQDLELSSDWIEVQGGLYVGSAQQPFLHEAVITLTGAKTADSGCFGNKYIGLLDGTLELYGDPAGGAWTRLDGTVDAGASSITVDDATGWRVGDAIVIASTDYFSYAGETGERYDRQVEERTIAAIDGTTLTLDQPLEFMHYGLSQSFGAGAKMTLTNTVLESRAEVARLSRNVVIRGDADTLAADSDRYRHGGHIMAMGASRIRLDSVELTRMGQAGVLLRYPIHFHLMGDAGNGSFIRNSSLHHLFNRCITIHGTNDVLVRGNAAYDTFGHCYFLEDGAELGNVLDGNLGVMVRAPREAAALLPSDATHLGPSVFWLTNPANVVTNNVAASSEGTGFWYALPEHPTGP